MIQVQTYQTYDAIPAFYRKQWCRMHLQRFPHVPRARKLWRNKTKALLCLLVQDKILVLSWCMYIRRKSGLEMYTYTRKICRGHGFGKRIAKAAEVQAEKRWPRKANAKFFPHDDRAASLYASLGYCKKRKKKRKAA